MKKSVMLETVQEVQDWVNKIIQSRWTKSHYPDLAVINVFDGRLRKSARGLGKKRGGFIEVPPLLRWEYIILHEIAHVLTSYRNVAGHGRLFCRTFLALVSRWMGKKAGRDLRKSFREHRVKWYPKRGNRESRMQVATA